LNDNTRLLPKNEKTKKILERNELRLFGQIPDIYKNMNIDITKLNKTPIKKISAANNHCLILFSDGELYGFGDNITGQLGLPIAKDINYVSEIRELRLDIPGVEGYRILDIATGDTFSLILIGVKNGVRLVRLGLKKEDIYRNDILSIKTVVRR
jgi:alpha-tubulin suppressor-like RCC1 family protein